MNDLQKKELELLKCFTEICDRLGLRYYLVCGSALGAVKYGGFIPWDDDVDVGLLREDYELFLEQAPALLPEHLFLQNYRTDPAFPAIFSKLRNSDTTFIERSAASLPIHHGIYIDIFPLDGYPRDMKEQRKLELKKWCYRWSLALAFLPKRKWKQLLTAPIRALGIHRHTAKIARRYENLISQYPTKNSDLIANHGNWQGKLEYAPACQYGDGVWGEFEGMKVRLPAQTDAYLRQKYGDYEKDLPIEQQVGHHDYTVCDCSRSYRDYL